MPDDIATGAMMLGFSDAFMKEDTPLDCSTHPLAHAIPGFDKANDTKIELRRILIDLSEALFENQTKPLIVWHFLLESQRGDDIQALNKSALYEISPFINDIYKKGNSGNSNIVVAPFMAQAGLRTAQGLSAMMCGVGSFPFNLSLSRDFGETPLPLRCLPDVLKDASFHTSAFHGDNLTFDNMLAFFTYHGFQTYDKTQYDQLLAIRKMGPLPMGHWGISDIAVYDQALKITQGYPKNEPQYNFLITMSNHGPNGIPEDMPKVVTNRVMDALNKNNINVGDDYITRLLTFAYADYALEIGVNNIRNGPGGKDAIIIGLADHTIGDKFLWKKESRIRGKELLLAASRIPFFIILPEFENVDKREKVNKAVAG